MLAVVTGVLFVVTLFCHEWLEAFGFDPDQGSGTAEWLIVGALLLACAITSVISTLEWRRTPAAPPEGVTEDDRDRCVHRSERQPQKCEQTCTGDEPAPGGQ